jgi:hypothetical protein
MDIIKKNILIAEFMGGEYKSKYRECSDCGKPTNELLEKVEFDISNYCPSDLYYSWCTPSELEYHKSWDWLMPVVEKIEDLVDYDKDAYNKYGDLWCELADDKLQQIRGVLNLIPKIDQLYNSVISFIKFHNSSIKEYYDNNK